MEDCGAKWPHRTLKIRPNEGQGFALDIKVIVQFGDIQDVSSIEVMLLVPKELVRVVRKGLPFHAWLYLICQRPHVGDAYQLLDIVRSSREVKRNDVLLAPASA